MRLADAGERLAESVGLAWAIGLALYTSTYFTLYLAGVPTGAAIAPALLITCAGVAGGLAALRAAHRRVRHDDEPRRHDDEPRRHNLTTALVVAVGLSVAVVQVMIAVSIGVGSQLRFWDAWFVWAVKARMFAFDGPPPGYFDGRLGPIAHPDYPLNLPLAEATLFRLPDPLGLRLASIIGVVCLAALLLLFYVGLARLYGRDRAALAVGLMALLPWLTRWAGLGEADVPLALYGGGAALYLVLWWRWRQRRDMVVMALLAGGAVWTKKEGLPIAALLLLAFSSEESVCGEPLRRRLSSIALAIAVTIVIPLPWFVFSHTAHPAGTDFVPLTPGNFVAHADRIPHILPLFGREMLTTTHWSFFWIVVGVAIMAMMVVGPSRVGLLLFLLLLGHLGVYVVGFVFSHWTSYIAHIQTSLDRLLLHAVPWALLLLLEAVDTLLPVSVGRSALQARRQGARQL